MNGCWSDSSMDFPVDDGFETVYRLRSRDPLYIRFSGIQEQQQLEVSIDQGGYIRLLHIKEPIKAAGLTTTELEDKIESLYLDSKIYNNISVNVTMTDKNYYVQGEVHRPGKYSLTSETTLLQAIADSGGFTAFAKKDKVTVSRHGKVRRFNIKKLEEDPSHDLRIEPGDVIKVWQSPY
jgi:polysaccharide export outer membrane protein